MKSIPTVIPDVCLLEPRVFGDARGYFFESYNAGRFAEATGERPAFVQDNQSFSTQGVLRGLHYQVIRPQAKLVRAVQGEIFDVAVDLRQSSPTFGQHVGVVLSGENQRQLWVPVGFAHGFYVLSETALVLYKTTDYYSPEGERSILWNDPALAIEWPVAAGDSPAVSDKDLQGLSFAAADKFA
ncbi:MAG TPA: dTDP-4-dehydrorhamnose 3,5-epimerase [Woeseiaceae bacterium]|nr:dTDP-4-dehydrorhamnose 3,5-epimerase [Woeseiaceae bacterium]